MHFLMRFEKKWKVNEAGKYREGYSEGGEMTVSGTTSAMWST